MHCSKTLSFDHVVGEHEKIVRHFEPERLGGGKIDGEVEFGRLLDRDIAGFGPTQNLVDDFGSAPEHIWEVWSVGHQNTGLDKIAGADDSRQPGAKHKRDNARAVGVNESFLHEVNCIRWALIEANTGAISSARRISSGATSMPSLPAAA